jgi:hypothetical protein
MYAQKLKPLLSAKPEVWNEIVSAAQPYDTEGGLVLQFDPSKLSYDSNRIVAGIFQAKPNVAAPTPSAAQKVMDAPEPAADEEDEVDQTLRGYFQAAPWMYSEANASVLRSKLAAHPEETAEVLAQRAGLQPGPQAQEALAAFYGKHDEILYCDANTNLILRNIQKGALLTASAIEAAGMNVYKNLAKDPRVAWQNAEIAKRKALEERWAKEVSTKTKPDPTWSITTLEEQIRLRTARASELRKEVGTRPALREPTVPPTMVLPYPLIGSNGITATKMGGRTWVRLLKDVDGKFWFTHVFTKRYGDAGVQEVNRRIAAAQAAGEI